jgi:hypothetical protein
MFFRLLSASAGFLSLFIFLRILSIENFQIFNLSFPKAFVLFCILLIGLFFLGSVFILKVRKINALIIINLFFIISGSELVIRLMEAHLPFMVVEMLPNSDRKRILEDRGLFNQGSLVGDGMLYSWQKKNSGIKDLPWVTVDSNGYRNSNLPNSVDVVLLGDSVTIAQNSKRDMASFLNEDDISTINLGFGSYGPPHYRDAYKKFILDQNIKARIILINFCNCNDVSDSQAYNKVKKLGGNWTDYLNRSATKMGFPFRYEPSWVLSILFKYPYKFVQDYRNKIKKSPLFLELLLPRKKIVASSWGFLDENKKFTYEDWTPSIDALSNIFELGKKNGSTVILAYYPNLAQLYLNHIPKQTLYYNSVYQNYNDNVFILKKLAEKSGGIFIDYTLPLQLANSNFLVTTEDSDYHPNIKGVEIMTNTVLPIIKESLSKKAE